MATWRRLRAVESQLRSAPCAGPFSRLLATESAPLINSPLHEDVYYLWPPGEVPQSLQADGEDTEAYLPQHGPEIAAGTLSGSKKFNFERWPESHLWRGAHMPAVRVFRPAPDVATGAAIVIAPGGGFVNLPPHEGDAIAEWLADQGVTAFLLRYRLVSSGYPLPTQLRDMQRAIRLVRFHAATWEVDPHRIGVLGVSGGGHVASGAAVFNASADPVTRGDGIDQVSAKPDATVLVYPLTDPSSYGGFTDPARSQAVWGATPPDPALYATARYVTAETGPTFITHSTKDTGVTAVDHGDPYFAACEAAGVDVTYSRIDYGGHGCGLVGAWGAPCVEWLQAQQFASAAAGGGAAYIYDFEDADQWQEAIATVDLSA